MTAALRHTLTRVRGLRPRRARRNPPQGRDATVGVSTNTSFTQSELEHVVRALPGQSWWSEQGKRLGLSSLSIEVIRRNLPDARRQPLSPEVARVLEAVRRRRVG